MWAEYEIYFKTEGVWHSKNNYPGCRVFMKWLYPPMPPVPPHCTTNSKGHQVHWVWCPIARFFFVLYLLNLLLFQMHKYKWVSAKNIWRLTELGKHYNWAPLHPNNREMFQCYIDKLWTKWNLNVYFESSLGKLIHLMRMQLKCCGKQIDFKLKFPLHCHFTNWCCLLLATALPAIVIVTIPYPLRVNYSSLIDDFSKHPPPLSDRVSNGSRRQIQSIA